MWIVPKTDWTGQAGEYFNIEDWNRVENDIRYLAEFYHLSLNTKVWGYTSLPAVYAINNIKKAINTLSSRTGLGMLTINENPRQKFDYTDMNRIEEKLLQIYTVTKQDAFRLRRCGTFVCGQAVYLPNA